jgi:hypothetical protein
VRLTVLNVDSVWHADERDDVMKEMLQLDGHLLFFDEI